MILLRMVVSNMLFFWNAIDSWSRFQEPNISTWSHVSQLSFVRLQLRTAEFNKLQFISLSFGELSSQLQRFLYDMKIFHWAIGDDEYSSNFVTFDAHMALDDETGN